MPEVIIFYPQPNDDWPYFTCPKCGHSNITRTFHRCVDCGSRITWKKIKQRTIEEMGVRNDKSKDRHVLGLVQ